MNPYRNIKAQKPSYSTFNLSYRKLLSCDMGDLIPIMHDEVVPGDIFHLGVEAVVRLLPAVAPLLHDVNIYINYYFVPFRLLWPTVKSGSPIKLTDGWELFITGGEDGTGAPTMPTWNPSSVAEGSIWDYLGFPVNVTPDADNRPQSFPLRAYNMIWNEYYRFQEIQDLRDLDAEGLLLGGWPKDYFTSCLLDLQRGTPVALPVSGVLNVDAASAVAGSTGGNYTTDSVMVDGAADELRVGGSGPSLTDLQNALEKQTVDLAGATTFDINDMRLASATQRLLELNARGGSRYNEQIYSHFDVKIPDERLQRPQYLGGCKIPLVVSEVLQTSESNATAQGTLAGHAIGADTKYIGRQRFQEHGIVMGLMCIKPKPVYEQGINRQWMRKDRFDYYDPIFANIGEQPVYRSEIYASGVKSENETIFGYQGRHNEMRSKHDMVVAKMRGALDYWHVSRQFGTAPALNSDFVKCDPRKDWLAVPSYPTFVCNIGNIIKAIRPMPAIAEPGLGLL